MTVESHSPALLSRLVTADGFGCADYANCRPVATRDACSAYAAAALPPIGVGVSLLPGRSVKRILIDWHK